MTRYYYDRHKAVHLLLMLSALFLGAIFYYYFCPDVYFVKAVDAATKWNIHYRGDGKWNCIIEIIRNYGMVFIWAFAFVNGMLFFSSSMRLVVIVIISIVVGATLEVFQYTKVISGTFDVIDIAVETAGVLLAVYIKTKTIGGENEKN